MTALFTSFLKESTLRLLMTTALVGSLVSSLFAVSVANEVPLELPKLTVTDQRPLPPPEAWRYGQIPGIEILSGASNRETQKLLRDFQLFNEAIGVVWPALKSYQPRPISLILCGPGKFDAFKPADDQKIDAGRASLLLKSPEQAVIILNFGVKVIDLVPSEADAAIVAPATPADDPSTEVAGDPSVTRGTLQVDYYRQLYHEYVRYLLSFNQPRLPAWLEEGLAQLLMGMRVNPKFIEFAKLENPNLADLPGTSPQEHDFSRALASTGLMPLEDFFAVTHNSPEATNQFTSKWAKQAQGLIHMWLYGEGKRYNKGFAQFVARSMREPVTEAMFKKCFGMGYREMLTSFRIYVGSSTAYQYQEFQAGKNGGLPEPVALTLRDATQAEVGRIKGEAQLLAGHPDQARDEMIAPYVRGVTDTSLLASLGLMEQSRGENARARKFLEAAAKLNVVRPRAYLTLAELRFAEAQKSSADTAPPPLNADQTKAVLQPLLIARQQPPPMPEVYELMAEVWLHSTVPPTKSDFGVLNQGVLRFQRRPVLLLRAAELNAKYGDPAEALLMANYGIKLSQTPDARQAFEDVKASLPPVTPK